MMLNLKISGIFREYSTCVTKAQEKIWIKQMDRIDVSWETELSICLIVRNFQVCAKGGSFWVFVFIGRDPNIVN